MSPWVAAGINLLAWPGVGTFAGGHKVSGAIQASMALIGGILSLSLIIVLFNLAIVLFNLALKLDSTRFDTEEFMAGNGTYLIVGMTGFCLLAFAWIWAAVSSFLIVNESKTSN